MVDNIAAQSLLEGLDLLGCLADDRAQDGFVFLRHLGCCQICERLVGSKCRLGSYWYTLVEWQFYVVLLVSYVGLDLSGLFVSHVAYKRIVRRSDQRIISLPTFKLRDSGFDCPDKGDVCYSAANDPVEATSICVQSNDSQEHCLPYGNEPACSVISSNLHRFLYLLAPEHQVGHRLS